MPPTHVLQVDRALAVQSRSFLDATTASAAALAQPLKICSATMLGFGFDEGQFTNSEALCP